MKGLTVVLKLSEIPHCHVTSIARHMPGDLDAEYASPWTGAIFLPLVNNLYRLKDTQPSIDFFKRDEELRSGIKEVDMSEN